MREPVMKRVLDLAFAGTALLAASPLLAVCAAAIKLESRGPVFYAQERVGRDRRKIRTLKLRTMVADADRRGPQITAAADPRVTRVGRLLRRTKLDELPQLWNVLRGEMSIVGPRPEVPRYASRYRPEWQRLFSVPPGLTDLASIVFRDEERLLARASDRERAYLEVIMPLKLSLALDGLERSSVRYDLGIIARTALAIVRPRMVEHDPVLVEAARLIDQLNRAQSEVS